MKTKIFLILIVTIFLNGSDYKTWLKNEQNEYKDYKKSLDEEFADMLKKDWEAFKAEYDVKPYMRPKPRKLPKTKEVVPTKQEIKKSKKVIIDPIVIKKPVVPIIKPVIIKEPQPQMIKFDFYAQSVNFKYDKKSVVGIGGYSKSAISSFWNTMSQSNYQILITQINNYSNSLDFNDWAKYKLTWQLGYEIYKNRSKANLFTWFLFSKMGYDMKVGFNSNKIILMSNSANKMFQVSYFRLDGKKYYVLNSSGKVRNIGRIFTYRGSYPTATRRFSLDIKKPIKLANNIAKKRLNFSYHSKVYNINAQYSKSLVEFYKTYPQANYRVYFDSQKSPMLDSMLYEIKPMVDGMSELQAVNFLLRLTQKSFEYKTDPRQFGYEKVLFPEETLYYPFSDCEDRSIFFAYLVKNLLGLSVVGVKYSNHLATAVEFSTTLSGDSFKHNGRRYTITDPTYINANAGMTMTQYRGKSFKIIDIEKD